MPSPLGEGQTDMPIAQVNRGEVPNPSPVSPKGEKPIHHRTKSFPWKFNKIINRLAAFPSS